MHRSILFPLLIWVLFQPLTGKAQWKFEKGSTSFSIKNAGLTVNGNFTGIAATVQFDPTHPELARIVASVEVKTLETGIGMRNKHVKGDGYFDAERFPTIKMMVTKFRKSENQWICTCQLTIKETTKSFEIPVQFVENGKTATLKSLFTINRLDYHVGESSWTMGDLVKIEITANLSQP